MIIQENKIIDQFPALKHQKNLATILKTDKAKLLAKHSSLFSIIINVIILI